MPWVIHELRRRAETVERKLPADLVERYGIFVTCQIGDDVPYLIKSCMGENTLMIGTDYGHADSSTELSALTTLKKNGGLSAEMHRKIVEDNPRAFYGLG
jgi:predicted TIM-barrel fold metal-dependent hydrolase